MPCSSQKVLVQHFIELLAGKLALLAGLGLRDQSSRVNLALHGGRHGKGQLLQQKQQQEQSQWQWQERLCKISRAKRGT